MGEGRLTGRNRAQVTPSPPSCKDQKIYNNAAQHWNHTFFWHCITPFKSEPEGELLKTIVSKWGSVEGLIKDFSKEAVGNFGSGWIWLVRKGKDIAIMNTSNADNPLSQGYQPLLTIDVWKHAYYIDYRNFRAKFV